MTTFDIPATFKTTQLLILKQFGIKHSLQINYLQKSHKNTTQYLLLIIYSTFIKVEYEA